MRRTPLTTTPRRHWLVDCSVVVLSAYCDRRRLSALVSIPVNTHSAPSDPLASGKWAAAVPPSPRTPSLWSWRACHKHTLAPRSISTPNALSLASHEPSTSGTLHTHTHTHTHTQPFNGFCPGLPGWAGTRRNTHPLTPILIIGHPLSSSSIYNDPWHPLCSFYVLDSPLGQPLSSSSLVFLLVLDPQLHTPCISSPNHHHLFAAHAHTNAACSAAIPVLCHLYLVSLSAPYLGVCLFCLSTSGKLIAS